jgi:hypothetical protein
MRGYHSSDALRNALLGGRGKGKGTSKGKGKGFHQTTGGRGRGGGRGGGYNMPRRQVSGTLDLSSLASALPTETIVHSDGHEQDPSSLRRRAALNILMGASTDENKVTPNGDASPLGYCQSVVRETLFEHRAMLGQTRLFDQAWARWPPIEEKAERGQYANQLVLLANDSYGNDVVLAFVTYNMQRGEYNLAGATCDAVDAFKSCFNRFAAERVTKGCQMVAMDSGQHPHFHPLEYIGDAVAAVDACLLLQRQAAPSDLLCAIANPRTRQQVAWRPPAAGCAMLNASQHAALASLRYNLEVIQGPPGTGKSTTIFHLVRDCMPLSTKSVVCAVQNRAVEAICQRLSSAVTTGDFKFFVFGNEKRLAETSKMWTLGAQADRDPRVLYQRAIAAKARMVRSAVNQGLDMRMRKTFPGAFSTRHGGYRSTMATRLIQRGCHRRSYGSYQPEEDASQQTLEQDFRNYLEANDGWLKLARACARKQVGGGRAAELDTFLQRTATDATEREQVLLLQIPAELARDASVMLCTAATVGPSIFSGDENVAGYMKLAEAVVVDEAGTCPDRSIVPLLPNGACFTRVVLVGDDKQLPPFSRLDEQERKPSLLQRAVSKVGGHLLNLQYRMPSPLCTVVSEAFYDGQLITAPPKMAECRMTPGKSIVFMPVHGEAMQAERGKSLFNEEEADVAMAAAVRLSRQHRDWSVAILTFYKEQFKLINDALKDEPSGINVLSVDSAQGQEFDAVVLSAVVNGSRKSFLSDERRQCVAISRAKKHFILVAHPNLCNNMSIFGKLRDAANRM